MINEKIKVVIWDLDDTFWKGTLAENTDVVLKKDCVEIVTELNKRGIVSAICSKNDFETAREKLIEFHVWDLFVFPYISFSPKGEMIKDMLKNMNLRPANALFIDDNDFNLREVKHCLEDINLLNACDVSGLLRNPNLQGKNDETLTRYFQYKQLEKKVEAQSFSNSNEEFLRESNINVELIDYTNELFDRIFELSERTNQLNFTKLRLDPKSLKAMLENNETQTKVVHVIDNFGDYGLVGFYTLKGDTLLHFVFSCRIMNMGIEQWVYARIGFPKLTVRGEVASEINGTGIPDYIHELSLLEETNAEVADINQILSDKSKLDIFAIGACDLYHPIAYFSMPNINFIYECNVYKGKERGVNVGTEYIRSQEEMNDYEKNYCRAHFNNYISERAFHSKIFEKKYDYIIMSFHDDMILKIYHHKKNDNLRILRCHERKFGDTSVIDAGKILNQNEEKEFLDRYFYKGAYITEKRFKENLIWIKNKLPEKTKIILINGPELDFFRKNTPHCSEVLTQIKKLNNVLLQLEDEYPDKFAVVDINKCIKSINDVTDYVFHLKANTAYALFVETVWAIIRNFPSENDPMLKDFVCGKKLVIYGNNQAARNAFYNCRLGGIAPIKYVHFDYENKKIGTMKVESENILKDKAKDYYVLITDENNYTYIANHLKQWGYTAYKDYVLMRPISYKKVWNDQQ